MVEEEDSPLKIASIRHLEDKIKKDQRNDTRINRKYRNLKWEEKQLHIDISSDKQTKYHPRRIGQESERETFKEKRIP